jgi:hypothetical protein
MGKLWVAILSVWLIISCTHQKNLSEQLNDSFADHLKKIDSLTTMDSVHLLWNTTVTEKLGRIFDDTAYLREFMRVQAQLLRAQQENKKDSIEYYLYEKNNLEKGMDSVTRSIAQGDTTRRYGSLIGCVYFISRNQKTTFDTTMIFIDSRSTLRYTEFMDSAIKRTIKRLN